MRWESSCHGTRLLQDHVPGLEILLAPRIRDEVDAFGCPAGEDDFISAAGIDEFRSADAGGFKRGCGAIAQFMDAAMDIGIVVFVVMAERVNHRARFLRCGGVVEIDQRLAVDFLIEDREVLPQCSPISHLASFYFEVRVL